MTTGHPQRWMRTSAVASLLLAVAAVPAGFALSLTTGPEGPTIVRGMIIAKAIAGLALLLAAAALVQIKLAGARVWDQGLVLAAVLASVAGLGLSLMGGAAAPRKQRDVRSWLCEAKLKTVFNALELSTGDNNGVLPLARGWCDSISPYLKTVQIQRPYPLVCPEAPDLRCGYAFNTRLSGVRADTLTDPHSTVAVFESDAGWNATGGPELLPNVPRHHHSDYYAFADGRVALLPRKRLRDGSWAKEPNADWATWDPFVAEAAKDEQR